MNEVEKILSKNKFVRECYEEEFEEENNSETPMFVLIDEDNPITKRMMRDLGIKGDDDDDDDLVVSEKVIEDDD